MEEKKPYCSDKDIAEAAVTGVVAGVAAAALIKAIGLGNTILLGVVIYLAWKYWDKIMAFFA